MLVLKLLVLMLSLSLSFSLECRYKGSNTYSNNLTQSSFCDVSGSCCTENWEPLVNSTWNDIFAPLIAKFNQLQSSLQLGVDLFNGVVCNDTLLLKSAEQSLLKLSGINWTDLISQENKSKECLLKIVQTHHCTGSCLPVGVEGKPCLGFCVNVVHGCFHNLAENILSPWKHALNSVRTAIRLIHAQQGCFGLAKEELDFFVSNLNTWREPLNWIDAVCDLVANPDNNNCFDGKDVHGSYKKLVTTWTSKSNPEFLFEMGNDAREINQATDTLINITKSLDQFWPVQSVSEEYELSVSDEGDISEEEDYEFGSGSGYHHPSNSFETDDEDLINGGGYESSGDVPDLLPPRVMPPSPPSSPPNNNSPIKYANLYLILVVLMLR